MVIHLVSGPVHSGKTTRLANWCRQRNDVGGLLSPVLYEKRYFLDIFLNEWRPMEAEIYEEEVQLVGPYAFSEAAFQWGNQVLLASAGKPCLNWLIVDEIGPLELMGQGLHPALDVIFNRLQPPLHVVLVIRHHLVQAVSEFYNFHRFTATEMNYPDLAPL